MPQPVSAPITSTPSSRGQPYDATANNTSPWTKLEQNAGPASINDGHVTGGFASGDGWKQV